jgi:hypothetical protein
MGTRETVGIALFAVALAITLSLTFNNDGLADGGSPRPISTGLEPPTYTPPPAATPTQAPVLALGEPADVWFVSFFRHGADGEPQLEIRVTEETIALDFANAPFPDMQDDNWSVEATAPFERPPGRYEFSLETTGAVTVRANGRVVFARDGIDGPETFVVTFDHLGGRLDIEVAASDTGGAFRLAVE